MKQKKFIICIISAILLLSCNLGIKNPNQLTIQLGSEHSTARGICDGNEVVKLDDDNNLRDVVIKITTSDGQIKTYTKSDNTLTVNSDSITIANTEFTNDFSIELEIISKVARYIGQKNNVVLDNPSTQTVIIPITEVRPHILLYGTTDSTGGSGSSGFKYIFGFPDITDKNTVYSQFFNPENAGKTDNKNTLKCLTLDKYGRICLLTSDGKIKIIHNGTAITSNESDIKYFTVETDTNTIYALTTDNEIVKYSLRWNEITKQSGEFEAPSNSECITTSKDYIAVAKKDGTKMKLSIHDKDEFDEKKEIEIENSDIKDIKIIDDKIYVLIYNSPLSINKKNKMSRYNVPDLDKEKTISIFQEPVKFLGIQNDCLYIADRNEGKNLMCEYNLKTEKTNFIQINDFPPEHKSKMNFIE